MSTLDQLVFEDGRYRTMPRPLSLLSRGLPSLAFYPRLIRLVCQGRAQGKSSGYNASDLLRSSLAVLRALETVGVTLEIEGVENFRSLEGPCVFAANHMSSLETLVLPAIIGPLKEVTFVAKEALLRYPVFRHIVRAIHPITVGRQNPRNDLKVVLEEGLQRLMAGVSVVIFPQATWVQVFDRRGFNTMGTKLAARANVPMVPLALKTDAWARGRILSDLGTIDPSRKVHFAFGKPLSVKGRGTEEHNKGVEFIQGKLKEWHG